MDYSKNESLKSEMEYNEKEGARNNIAISAQINKLQEIGMLYAQKIEMENQKNKQLEDEIKLRERLIQDQRNKLREDNNAPKNLSKQIKQTKNEISKKIGVLNETNAENKQLRLKINFLRKERTIFDGIYNKLETEILKKKNELLSLIEKKDEIQNKRAEKEKQFEYMQKQSAKENDFFEQHYASIIDNIDGDEPKSLIERPSDMHEMEDQTLDVNASQTDQGPKIGKRKSVLNQGKRDSTKGGHKKLDGSGMFDSGRKVSVSDFNERFDMLSEMSELFNKLHLLTQEEDLELIKNYYKNGEQLNEETYQQIKKKEDEINVLEADITQVQKDLKSKTKGMDDETFKLHTEHEQLKAEIEKKQSVLEDYEKKEATYTQEYENLKTLTPVLMESMKCPITYVKGVTDVADFNENNVDAFLKAMDRRAAQIALFVKQIDNKNNEEKLPDEKKPVKEKNMQNSIANMSEISNLLYNEDTLRREELITGKMMSLREQIQSEIQKKISKPNGGMNKIPSKKNIEDGKEAK